MATNEYPEDPIKHDRNWEWAGHHAKIWMRIAFFRSLSLGRSK